MPLYSILFFLSLFLLLRYSRLFRFNGLNEWAFPILFSIKVLAGLFFIYVYSVHYGRGALSADAGAFMKESKMVNDVFYQSPIDYFKLLTGMGETNELIHKYLPLTFHWDVGDLTIINDSKNVLRIHSLIHFVSFGNESIHMLLMCFLSLISTVLLYKSFAPYTTMNKYVFFFILSVVPSTLFWTSGILKEPFMFFGLSLFIWGLLSPFGPLKKITLTLLGISIMILFKPYVLACMVPALLFFLIYQYLGRGNVALSFSLFLGLSLAGHFIFPSVEKTITHYLSRKQFDFDNVGKGGLHALSDSCYYYFKPEQFGKLSIQGNSVELIEPIDAYIIHFGSVKEPIPVHLSPNGEIWKIAYKSVGCASYIETDLIENSTLKLIKNIPSALLNSIFRPFPKDPGSWLKYPSMLELWGILIFMTIALIFRRKLSKKEIGIVIAISIFALSLFLLIGWTTPVIGAIARYRFPAQLALVLVGLIIMDPNKLLKHE